MIRRRIVDLLGEGAVITLTLAATLGLERFFTDRSFLPDLIVLVLVAHGVAILLRRAGLGVGLSAIVSAAGLLVSVNLLFFPETAGRVLPNRATVTLLLDDLDIAWTTFSGEVAPVVPLRGLVVVAALALWIAATLGDWAAFRLRSRLETIAPVTTIFVFTALLGDASRPLWFGGLYVAAVAAVLVTMRANRRMHDEVWVAHGGAAGATATVRTGAVGAAAAIAIGVLAAPMVPGAGEQLLDPSDWDTGPDTRRVVSPLVQINASLVEQSRFEMFSVAVEDPSDRAYWRQMALTSFDGRSWARSSNFEDARGPVGSDVDPSVPRRSLRQTITTSRLGGIYLPAAYEVASVLESGTVELEYETATGALVVTRGSQDAAARGFTYTIESAIPDFTPASLPDDATIGLDADFVEEHTALPPPCSETQLSTDRCWPDSVTALAEQITSGASTDFERVRRLQDHFLDPDNFTYDLAVSQRHDVNSIEDFLQVVRAGYCEQFASAFASMARSLGIPARVAVGFTWGEWNDARQEYVVRGEHAHAWPEVFFAGVGWVVFDPTPGRAPADNTDITGQAAAQLNENDEANRGVDPAIPTTLAPIAPGANAPPLDGGQFLEDDFDLDLGIDDEPVAPEPGGGAPSRRAGVVLVVAVALVGAVPLSRVLLRRRAFARVAADPIGRGELAWDQATAALRLAGAEPDRSETPIELATRLRGFPVAVGPIAQLAEAVTTLRYARPEDPVRHVRDAEQSAAMIVSVCRDGLTTRRRWAAALDPRTISSG